MKKVVKKKHSTSGIHFKIQIVSPHLHKYKVELHLDLKKEFIRLYLPTWTPGSYMIRDYSGNILGLEAQSKRGRVCKVDQKGLSHWDLFSEDKSFIVTYYVFGFEATVRTTFLDSEYGFINPPSFFLYPEKCLDHSITLEFEKSPFKNIYSPLTFNEDNFLFASDFDHLYDSPIHLSNKSSYSFDSHSCSHELIIEGTIPTNIKDNLLSDLKRITDKQSSMFGGNPNTYYLFILNLTESGYGGLEHSACSVNMFDPAKINDHNEYLKLLGLLCHEYFHLWNVKRIRPLALGPFDYQKPALTKELWIAEGITSFYDNYILFLTGITSTSEYLNEIVSDINRLEENWGEEWMSLEESSFTAWTKYYKQHSNSNNFGISYYIKGSIFILCIDIHIRELSSQKYSFFDVLLYLYKIFFLKKKRGFTKEEFFRAIQDSTKVDIYSLFSEYLESPKKLPFKPYLDKIGVHISKSYSKGAFPFETRTSSGKEIISKVYMQNLGGLDISTGDELIAVNKKRIQRDSLERMKTTFEDGEEIHLLISRRDKIMERKFTVKNIYNYKLDSIKYDNNPLGMYFFEGRN